MSASDAGLRGKDSGAGPRGGSPKARREAFQPSLWDRLVNDLPGLLSEIDVLRRTLEDELGAEKLEILLAGGKRAVDADTALAPESVRRLQRMLMLHDNRGELERRGVVVSASVLREAVRRDIEALFNTERFESRPLLSDMEAEQAEDDPPALADFPLVRRSVVNYGVPSFSGRSSRDFDRDTLAKEIRTILATYEPRLKDGATKVTVMLGDKNVGLKIDIDAVLIMTPTPERMRFRTVVNLDNGMARTEIADG